MHTFTVAGKLVHVYPSFNGHCLLDIGCTGNQVLSSCLGVEAKSGVNYSEISVMGTIVATAAAMTAAEVVVPS